MLYRKYTAWTAVLLLTGALSACPGLFAPPCDMDLVSKLDVEKAMEHIHHLSVDIGPRVVSSPEEREAAGYIAAVLADYGYDVEVQEFERPMVLAYLDVLQPEGLEIHLAAGSIRGTRAADYPLLTPDEGISGRIVDCGDGAPGACPEDVEGQIALVSRSDIDSEEVISNVADAGAAAVLIHGRDWRRYRVSVSSADIPFATLNAEAAEELRSPDLVVANLQVNLYTTSQNVIATRPLAGNPNAPVVIFTAHYDTVEKAPGASDNASGTAGLMELARVLARVPVGVELRFAAVGGEEGGLVGSRYYVSQLPEEEIERIVANFNMDMIGTAGEEQTTLYVNTLDGDNIVAQSARRALERLDLPEEMMRAPYQRGASDHVAFHGVGIPAANFIWRHPETAALEPWYHHPHDRIEHISEDRLRTAMEIVLTASLEVICEDAPLRPEAAGAGAN